MEKQVILAQEIAETEEEEDEESVPHKSEENEHAEQGLRIMQSASKSSEAESAEIATEIFSTASGNTFTVLGVEEAGKTDITESYLTSFEKEESLPMYLKYVLLTEAMFVKLKERIRLCFFEHLEKWFAESLSNSYVFVAAKKEELNSKLLLHLKLHQGKQEDIQTKIYNVRAEELSLHKEHLERHCAVLAEGLEKERAEFLRFSGQLNNLNTHFNSRVSHLEFELLHAPVTEQLFSEVGNFSSEEVKFFSKCLQKESKEIDSFESSIKTDVEQIKSSCLEQATELFKQSQKRFASLSLSRAFMRKVPQSLRRLRQQIKSEVANSNLQSAT
ncbi:coiled-coil domain-containing protein 180-like isoform X1 [Cyanistes caeruleus]|uniref:coiled-coil domain-containing protein 180-like isoform X1 n=1 Tax=Cyanistes caeruleus TaxID=156563 RepID=UPI000CDAAE72|nr:coiled-coil domain-containing protein 180-like isoform X1 [Cyanistes caeruleus]